jgi:HEAT repeat protein
VARWSKWLQARDLASGLAAGNSDAPMAALKSTDPVERWAAVVAIKQRKLEALRGLFELFRDPDNDVRAEARSVLTSIGPALRRPPLSRTSRTIHS